MTYRTKLPRYSKRTGSGDCNCCFFASVLLSILAHLLCYWLYLNRVQKPEITAEKNPQTMEVSLSAAPRTKSSAAQNASAPTPSQDTPPPTPLPVQPPKPIVKPKPAPKPTPIPKETTPVKKPIPKPKPIEPEWPEPPLEETPPEPPKPRKPVVKAKPAREPLPEFKDDFSSLSTDYSHETPVPQGTKDLGGNSAQSDGGNHPGSILNINPKTHYPLQAMRQGLTGMVVVLIHIAPDGTTDGVDLLQSSGHDALDNEVLGSVQHWRFKPPMRNGKPVEGVFKHRVIFGSDENVVDDFENHWQEIELQPADK